MRPDMLGRHAAPLLEKLRPKRSAGVPVSGAVYREIAAGNAARERRAWETAAQAYAAALEMAPELFHIWIQHGHALKESGESDGAVASYARAQALRPESGEPHLHLGHLAKSRGDMHAAAGHYAAALRAEPGCPDALGEIRLLIAKGAATDMRQLDDLLGEGMAIAPIAPIPSAAGASAEEHAIALPCVVFDVSDLIAYFNHARHPSGIQRVQIETLRCALAEEGRDVRICAFHEARDEWIEIPRAQFVELCRLSGGDDVQGWPLHLAKLGIRMATAEPFAFPRGALLVNLGTSWWIPNYFMFVRNTREASDIRYMPFVHDLIPLVRPELCPPLLARDFMAWIISVLDHADFYLVNSLSTKRDLMQVSAYLGRPVAADRIEVVKLDARSPAGPASSSRTGPGLRRIGLQLGDFALIVSTIEPRKNHLLAFEAWAKLIDRHGARRVPRLVCVGNRGWMNEPIHEYLAARPELRSKILILSDVSDEELQDLYRNCLFTLYPSQYEGWGLPVTESLSKGKPALCARNSSIPEAGGSFADYFSPDSRTELIAGIERLAFDAGYRRERARNIVENFRPRSWEDVAHQILASVIAWGEDDMGRDKGPPRVESNRYYPLSRDLAPRLWPGIRATEGLRAGPNWWGQDPWGCWTKAGGGSLRFAVPDARKPHLVYLDLLGMPGTACQLRVDANGREGLEEIVIPPNQRRWLPIEVPGAENADAPITIDLICETFEDLGHRGSGDGRTIAVGVYGFYLCEADDTAGRMALLEAVTLATVDRLSPNRPPADQPSLLAYMEGAALV